MADEMDVVLDEEGRRQAQGIARRLRVNDFNGITSFGSSVQVSVSDSSRKLFERALRWDDSNISTILSSLQEKVNGVDLSPKIKWWQFLKRIFPPRTISQAQLSQFQKIGVEVDYLGKRLEVQRRDLLAEVGMLERLYEENLLQIEALKVYVAAGRQKLAEEQGRPGAANYLELLDRRVYDLQVSLQVSSQQSIQLKMLITNHLLLAERITSSILNLIPLWRDGLAQSLAAQKQLKTMEEIDLRASINEVLAIGHSSQEQKSQLNTHLLKQK